MATVIETRTEDRTVTVDGLGIRYIEQGSGAPALPCSM